MALAPNFSESTFFAGQLPIIISSNFSTQKIVLQDKASRIFKLEENKSDVDKSYHPMSIIRPKRRRRKRLRKRQAADKSHSFRISEFDTDRQTQARQDDWAYYYDLQQIQQQELLDQQKQQQAQLNQHPQRPAILANSLANGYGNPHQSMGMKHPLKPIHRVPYPPPPSSLNSQQQTMNGLLALLLLFIISIFGSIGSIFIMSALTVIESLQTRGNCYLVSLALSHLLVSLFVIPSSALQIMAGKQGLNSQALCRYQWLTLEFSLMVGHVSFALIAVDNYLGYSYSEKVVTRLAQPTATTTTTSSTNNDDRRAGYGPLTKMTPPDTSEKPATSEMMKYDTPLAMRAKSKLLQDEFFKTNSSRVSMASHSDEAHRTLAQNAETKLMSDQESEPRNSDWIELGTERSQQQQQQQRTRWYLTLINFRPLNWLVGSVANGTNRLLSTRRALDGPGERPSSASQIRSRNIRRAEQPMRADESIVKHGELESEKSLPNRATPAKLAITKVDDRSLAEKVTDNKGKIGWRLAEQFAGDHSGSKLKRPGCFSYRSCCGRFRVLLWILLTWSLAFFYLAYEGQPSISQKFCSPLSVSPLSPSASSSFQAFSSSSSAGWLQPKAQPAFRSSANQRTTIGFLLGTSKSPHKLPSSDLAHSTLGGDNGASDGNVGSAWPTSETAELRRTRRNALLISGDSCRNGSSKAQRADELIEKQHHHHQMLPDFIEMPQQARGAQERPYPSFGKYLLHNIELHSEKEIALSQIDTKKQQTLAEFFMTNPSQLNGAMMQPKAAAAKETDSRKGGLTRTLLVQTEVKPRVQQLGQAAEKLPTTFMRLVLTNGGGVGGDRDEGHIEVANVQSGQWARRRRERQKSSSSELAHRLDEEQVLASDYGSLRVWPSEATDGLKASGQDSWSSLARFHSRVSRATNAKEPTLHGVHAQKFVLVRAKAHKLDDDKNSNKKKKKKPHSQERPQTEAASSQFRHPLARQEVRNEEARESLNLARPQPSRLTQPKTRASNDSQEFSRTTSELMAPSANISEHNSIGLANELGSETYWKGEEIKSYQDLETIEGFVATTSASAVGGKDNFGEEHEDWQDNSGELSQGSCHRNKCLTGKASVQTVHNDFVFLSKSQQLHRGSEHESNDETNKFVTINKTSTISLGGGQKRELSRGDWTGNEIDRPPRANFELEKHEEQTYNMQSSIRVAVNDEGQLLLLASVEAANLTANNNNNVELLFGAQETKLNTEAAAAREAEEKSLEVERLMNNNHRPSSGHLADATNFRLEQWLNVGRQARDRNRRAMQIMKTGNFIRRRSSLSLASSTDLGGQLEEDRLLSRATTGLDLDNLKQLNTKQIQRRSTNQLVGLQSSSLPKALTDSEHDFDADDNNKEPRLEASTQAAGAVSGQKAKLGAEGKQTRPTISSNGGDAASDIDLAESKLATQSVVAQLKPRRPLFWMVLFCSILLPSLASAILFTRAYFRMKEFKMRPYKPVPVGTLATTPPALLTPRSPIPLINQRQVYTFDNIQSSSPTIANSNKNALKIANNNNSADDDSDHCGYQRGQYANVSEEEDEEDPGEMLARAANEMARRVSAQSGSQIQNQNNGLIRKSTRRKRTSSNADTNQTSQSKVFEQKRATSARGADQHLQLNQVLSAPPISQSFEKDSHGFLSQYRPEEAATTLLGDSKQFQSADKMTPPICLSHISPVVIHQRHPAPIFAAAEAGLSRHLYDTTYNCFEQHQNNLAGHPRFRGQNSYSAPPTAGLRNANAFMAPPLTESFCPSLEQQQQHLPETSPAGFQTTNQFHSPLATDHLHSPPQEFAPGSPLHLDSHHYSESLLFESRHHHQRHSSPVFSYGQAAARIEQLTDQFDGSAAAAPASQQRVRHHAQSFHYGQSSSPRANIENAAHRHRRVISRSYNRAHGSGLCKKAAQLHPKMSPGHQDHLPCTEIGLAAELRGGEQLASTQEETTRDRSSSKVENQEMPGRELRSEAINIALANVIRSADEDGDIKQQQDWSASSEPTRNTLEESQIQLDATASFNKSAESGRRRRRPLPLDQTILSSTSSASPFGGDYDKRHEFGETRKNWPKVANNGSESAKTTGSNKVILCTYNYMTDDQLLKSNIIVFVFNFLLWLPFVMLKIMLHFSSATAGGSEQFESVSRLASLVNTSESAQKTISITNQLGENSTFTLLTPEFKNLAWWLATLNCCSCSYLYALTNKDFREAFKKLFYYCCCKSHVTFQKKTPIFRRQLDIDAQGNLRVHIIPGMNAYSNKMSSSLGPAEATATVHYQLVGTKDYHHHHHYPHSILAPSPLGLH